MALLDISKVTSTLVRLLDAHVSSSPAWPSGVTLNVSPDPPDRLEGDATLGVYLYHAVEDSHRKNLPPSGGNGSPIRFAPMGLNLHYQVTPHSELDDGAGALREQLMLGCALKAFHDFPVVDDDTEIAGTTVLHPSLVGADNRLRIVLQPLPAGEAATYWTAGSQPLRLAAYYDVAVILLEADEPVSRPGRVLEYGVTVFPAEVPRIEGSSSTLTFTIPGEAAPRETVARPAQVAPGDTLTVQGSALAGDDTTLLLRGASWDEPLEADPGWAVAATSTRLTANVQATVGGKDVVPGVYSAVVRVARRRAATGREARALEQPSNPVPFVVIPRLAAVSGPQADGRATITGETFEHPDVAAEDVEVYVGEARLERHQPPPAALPRGAFRVEDANTIQLRLPAGLAPGSTPLLRVVVNGAESPPRWVVVP
jgi:hypothetical protein